MRPTRIEATLDATSGGELKLAFAPMYSAHDGQHAFKVPLRVERAMGRLTLTSTPDAFVDAVPASFGLVLTTRQAGNTQIVVRDEAGNTGSASLTITRAEASDYERGKSQYHAQAHAGVNPPACSSCHVTGQAGGVDPAPTSRATCVRAGSLRSSDDARLVG